MPLRSLVRLITQTEEGGRMVSVDVAVRESKQFEIEITLGGIAYLS